MSLRPTRCGIAALLVVALGTTGCASATISPGRYRLGWCFIYCTPNRIEDCDVTYSAGTVDIDGEGADGLRSGDRSALARYSFTKLQRESERFENEVESDLRRRTAGHHLEIASVTIDSVS